MISASRSFLILLLGSLLTGLSCINTEAAKSASRAGDRWADSIITIETTRRQYDHFQPWSRRVRTTLKGGIVIGPREVLTTAEDLHDRTMIRFQRDGRGQWSKAQLIWIDYHANLAILSSNEEGFWTGLKPVSFANPVPVGKEGFQLARWRNGNLETRKMEFNQCVVDNAKISSLPMLQLELSSETQGVGWGEAILIGGKVAGIAASQNGNTCRAIPSSTIHAVLEARKRGNYKGMGYFDFVWQPAENPDTLQHLKLTGPLRGVIIVEIPKASTNSAALKARDIILKVDGFDVDTEGYYHDPDYGHLSIENIPTRGHWAGDVVKIQVLRDGKPVEVNYTLPATDYETKLLAEQTFDREPEYLIVGGLVFQPLNIPLLRSWGEDWKRRAPFRLAYYRNEDRTPEKPGLVVLTAILPDPVNLGYQDLRFLVLEELNGTRISKLSDIEKALTSSSDGFHRFKFARGDSVQRAVLDSNLATAAASRVLQRYGIPKDRVIASATSRLAPGAVPPATVDDSRPSRGIPRRR